MTGEVRITRLLAAPRELVFAAWIDPRQVASWWAPPGFEVPPDTVEIDARVGGRIHFAMVALGGGAQYSVTTWRRCSPPDQRAARCSGSPAATRWAAPSSAAGCVLVTAHTVMPAARPAATPAGASSNTRQAAGSTPSRSAPRA